MSHSDFFSKWVFRFAQNQAKTWRLWWHCRFSILINVCKLYKCKIISPNHPKILLGTWGQIFTKVTVWHDRSMEYNWVFYWVKSLRILSKSHTSMHIWSSLFKFWGIFYPTIRFGYLGRINQECHCVTVKPAPFLDFRFL